MCAVFCFWCYEHLVIRFTGSRGVQGAAWSREKQSPGWWVWGGCQRCPSRPLPTFNPVPGAVLKEYYWLPRQQLLNQEKGMTFI